MAVAPVPFPQSLCHSCSKLRLSGNSRGSVFMACTQGQLDPSWPKYLPQPVLRCAAFAPKEPPAPLESAK